MGSSCFSARSRAEPTSGALPSRRSARLALSEAVALGLRLNDPQTARVGPGLAAHRLLRDAPVA
eukprot:12329455-Alexandrium_andersonii.AAC.1